jgi:tetratricopeptide (TPR) repeat protein/predicted Ser/Thr protein kinase
VTRSSDVDETLGPSSGDETIDAGHVTAGRARPTTALGSGDLVGRYVILAKLGEGGMGVVYAAYDPELDRKVALKLLRSEPGRDPLRSDGRSRLLREAQALAKFTHPEIVTVHDVGEHEGAVWLAMEFIDGRTLGAWVRQTTRSWKEVLAVMLAAGRGVAAAHAAGMLHRDLKPDNIMVGHDGHVRVMDFGLGRARNEASAEEDVGLLGTPAYMAPERFEGREATEASDQFAFCVTLWQLLYGQRPFEGRTVMEIAHAVIEGVIRSPPKDRSVPGWLRRICERGLARDPAQRWPSMDTLLAELARGQSRVRTRRIAIGLGVIACLLAAAEGARRWDHAQRVAACELAGAGIEEVWNDDARERVREGLRATGLGYAETTADKVMPYLDEHALAWREHRTRACTQAEIEQSWDAATLDRSIWCLDERRFEFESVVEQLAAADAQVVQKAVSVAAGLTAIEPCVDEFVLRNLPEPPSEESRAAIAEVRVELARVGTLLAAGKISEGLAAVGPVRATAESLGWPPLIATALRREGELLQLSGEFAKAEAASVTAYVTAAKASVWDVAADAASDLIETVGDRQARYAEGRVWAQHAEVAIVHVGDPLGLREAKRATSLAHLEHSAGDYERSEALYRSALTIRTEVFGPDHPMLASSLNNLGLVHRARFEHEQAKTYFERSLALRENVLGPEHPDVAVVLHNLGLTLDDLGEHEHARQLYERALTTWERALGPDHPSAAATLAALGTAWGRQGEFERAKPYFERALAIQEQAMGSDHPDLAALLNNYSNVVHESGDVEQAQVLLERALAIQERVLGPEHPAVAISLFNLAMLLRETGDHARAKQLHERALPIAEATFGKDHPEVAWLLAEIGDAELALERPNEALLVLERAMPIYDAHPDVQGGEARARFALARALIATGGDRERAIAEAEKAQAGFREARDPGQAEVDAWLAAQAN